MRKALITGISGQDGSYLAEHLMAKGYSVHGMVRPNSAASYGWATFLEAHSTVDSKLILHMGDLLDYGSLDRLVRSIEPDEIYNLAGQSHVGHSYELATYTASTTGVGVLNLLEVIRNSNRAIRFYQAGSSEMFGNSVEPTQNESTPFKPESPYAVAKVFAHQTVLQYRNSFGIHASNGILFNHESPRRSPAFVTRKVTKAVAEIISGSRDRLILGNLSSSRDWGYAPEYVAAMHMLLQGDEPDDVVVATGTTHTVEELCEVAFRLVGLQWRDYVVSDPALYRPSEVHRLCGNPEKAQRILGWRPKTSFEDLIVNMLNADLERSGVSVRVSSGSLRS